MKNQQSETLAVQSKKRSGKRLRIARLGLGIIATAFSIIWLTMFADASSSRQSTPAEIAGQMKFQEKWNAAQDEFQQKVGAASKEVQQKSDSNGK